MSFGKAQASRMTMLNDLWIEWIFLEWGFLVDLVEVLWGLFQKLVDVFVKMVVSVGWSDGVSTNWFRI